MRARSRRGLAPPTRAVGRCSSTGAETTTSTTCPRCPRPSCLYLGDAVGSRSVALSTMGLGCRHRAGPHGGWLPSPTDSGGSRRAPRTVDVHQDDGQDPRRGAGRRRGQPRETGHPALEPIPPRRHLPPAHGHQRTWPTRPRSRSAREAHRRPGGCTARGRVRGCGPAGPRRPAWRPAPRRSLLSRSLLGRGPLGRRLLGHRLLRRLLRGLRLLVLDRQLRFICLVSGLVLHDLGLLGSLRGNDLGGVSPPAPSRHLLPPSPRRRRPPRSPGGVRTRARCSPRPESAPVAERR